MTLAGKVLISLGCLALVLPLRAQIALNTQYVSEISAGAAYNQNTGSPSNVSVSLPFTQAVTNTNGTTSATVTPDLTTSLLQLQYGLSFAPSLDSDSLGSAIINFVAKSNAAYTIAGTETVSGSGASARFAFSLYNSTTQAYLYQTDIANTTGTTNLVSSVGNSLTGTLVSGDAYQLEETDDLSGPANGSLTGTSSISFAPEPSSLALLGVGMFVGLIFSLWKIVLAELPRPLF